MINRVREVSSVSSVIAKSLLLKNKWDVNNSIKELMKSFESGGIEKIFNFKFA
mgnify:FL=1